MSKILLRLAAILLVPSLIVDPSLAASLHWAQNEGRLCFDSQNLPAGRQAALFDKQALAPAIFLAERIKNASLLTIRRTLGNLVRGPYLRHQIHQYQRAHTHAIDGLERNDLSVIARARDRMHRAARRLREIVDGFPDLEMMDREVQDVFSAYEILSAPPRQDLRFFASAQIADSLKQSTLPDEAALIAFIRPKSESLADGRRSLSAPMTGTVILIASIIGLMWLVPRVPRWVHAIENALRGENSISDISDHSPSQDTNEKSIAESPALSPSNAASLSPETIAKELQAIDREEKEIARRMASREQNIVQSQKTLDQAKKKVEIAQAKAEQERQSTQKKAKTLSEQKNLQAFEARTRSFQRGDQQTPPVSSHQAHGTALPKTKSSAQSQPSTSAQREDPIGSGTPGERRVIARFKQPVQPGFIPDAMYYTFDSKMHAWTGDPNKDSVASFHTEGPILNSVDQYANSSWTSLYVPVGMAPLSDSVRFNKHARFSLLRSESSGLYELWVDPRDIWTGLEFSFDLTASVDRNPGATAAPSPESRELIEDPNHWSSQTKAILRETRQEETPEGRVGRLQAYMKSTFVYLMSNEWDQNQQSSDPGHPIAALDRYQVQTEFGPRRFTICNGGNTLLAAWERELGDPTRYVAGALLNHSTTEISIWQRHAETDIYSGNHWFRVDGTPTQQSSLGVQNQFTEPAPTEPVIQASLATERQVHAAEEEYNKAKNLADQAAKEQEADRARLRALAQRRADLEAAKMKTSNLVGPASNQAEPGLTTGNQLSLRTWMTVLADANQKFEALARQGKLVSYVASGTWPELDAAQEIYDRNSIGTKARYQLAIYDLVIRRLPSVNAKKLYPAYLKLLKAWMESDESKKPLLFTEYSETLKVFKPASNAPNISPYPLVEHFDVSTYLPMPTAKTDGPGIVSTLVPSPAATRETPHWLEGVKGFVANDQIFDAQGHPLLAPPIQAKSIDHIVTTKDGHIYALVQVPYDSATTDLKVNNGSLAGQVLGSITTAPGVTNKIIDVLTGRTLSLPHGATRALDLRIAGDGRPYAVLEMDLSSPPRSLYEIRSDGSFREFASLVNNEFLLESNGRLFSFMTDPLYQVTEIKNPAPQGITMPPSLVEKIRKASRQASFQPSGIFDVAVNPKTNDIYFVWNYQGHAALYDQARHSLAPDDVQAITPPVFDSSGQGFYAARINGKWDLRSNERPEPLGDIPILVPPSEENVHILAVDFPMAIIRAANTVFIENIQTSEIKAFYVPRNQPVTAINGRAYFLVQQGSHRVLHEIRGSLKSVNSWQDKVVSRPEATDTTLPAAAFGEHGDMPLPIFSELVDGQWRWNRPLNDGLFNFIEVTPRPGRLHHFLAIAHLDQNPIVFDWDGNAGTTRIGGFSENAEFFDAADGLYQVTYGGPGPLMSWPGGEKASEVNVSPVSSLRMGSDGRLYYWGEQKGQDRLWRLPDKVPIFSASSNSYIQRIQFNADGKGYILTARSASQEQAEMTLYDFNGKLSYTVKIPLKSLDMPRLYFSPDGTPYLTLHSYPTTTLYNMATGTLLATQMPNDTAPHFAPDGKVFLLLTDSHGLLPGSVYLLNDQEKLFPIDHAVNEIAVNRDGDLYVRYSEGTYRWATPSLRVRGGLLPQFPVGTRVGVTWMPLGKNAWAPLTMDPIGGIGKPMAEMTYTKNPDNIPWQLKPQTGEAFEAPVIFIPSEKGKFALLIDPYQEERRLLEWALGMKIQNPALTQTKEWKDMVQVLVDRTVPHDYSPADRRLLLTMLTEGNPHQSGGVQPLSNLDRLPAAQKEARQALARIVVSVYRDYKAAHGALPFNPEGVRANWLSRWLNRDLQLSQPWRFGPTADEKKLVVLNAEVVKLINEHSWLRLSRDDVGEVWMSPGRQLVRLAAQTPSRWLFLFLLAELLSAAASRRADFLLRHARRSLFALFRQAAASDLFQFDSRKLMIPLPENLIPARSAWTHLWHSLTFLAFADWMRARRLAAKSEGIMKRMLAEGKHPMGPIGDTGSLVQFVKSMETMIDPIRKELRQGGKHLGIFLLVTAGLGSLSGLLATLGLHNPSVFDLAGGIGISPPGFIGVILLRPLSLGATAMTFFAMTFLFGMAARPKKGARSNKTRREVEAALIELLSKAQENNTFAWLCHYVSETMMHWRSFKRETFFLALLELIEERFEASVAVSIDLCTLAEEVTLAIAAHHLRYELERRGIQPLSERNSPKRPTLQTALSRINDLAADIPIIKLDQWQGFDSENHLSAKIRWEIRQDGIQIPMVLKNPDDDSRFFLVEANSSKKPDADVIGMYVPAGEYIAAYWPLYTFMQELHNHYFSPRVLFTELNEDRRLAKSSRKHVLEIDLRGQQPDWLVALRDLLVDPVTLRLNEYFHRETLNRVIVVLDEIIIDNLSYLGSQITSTLTSSHPLQLPLFSAA